MHDKLNHQDVLHMMRQSMSVTSKRMEECKARAEEVLLNEVKERTNAIYNYQLYRTDNLTDRTITLVDESVDKYKTYCVIYIRNSKGAYKYAWDWGYYSKIRNEVKEDSLIKDRLLKEILDYENTNIKRN